MDPCGGLLSKLKDLHPDLCVYFLQNYFENEKSSLGSFHTIPTTLLRDEQTYSKGLLVLNTFLDYCTAEDLNKAGALWLTPLMKHISLDVSNQVSNSCSVELSYNLLGKIIVKSSDAKELMKAIGITYLSRLVMNLVDAPKNCHLSALLCLQTCLTHYGGQCSPLQGRIERFILAFVDTEDDRLALEAGKCLLLMQQLSGGGVQGVNHHKAWGRLQNRLLVSLYDTLSAIFGSNVAARETAEATDDSLTLPEIDMSAGPLKRIMNLIQRFKNLTTFFSVALVGGYKTRKPVQPVKILKLISNTVETLGNTARNNLTLEDVVTVHLLPLMHESVLDLLKALIGILRGNMVLFSRSVCSILLSSLKCAAKSTSLRIATYQLFVFWCKTVNTSSCVEDISEVFFTSIVRDTKPFVVKVQLQVNGTGAKSKSKRLKRKLGEDTVKDDGEEDCERHLNDEKYEQLCCEALTCLRQLIRCSSCSIKLDQMKLIYDHAMALIVQNVEIDPKKRPLYANRECRKCLFLLLKELLVTAFVITLPQSQFLVHVFSQAQHSETWHENRALCTEILGDLDKMIHPQKLEFQFPLKEEVQPMKLATADAKEDDSMVISDEEEREEIEEVAKPEEKIPSPDVEKLVQKSANVDVIESEAKAIEVESYVPEEQQKVEEKGGILKEQRETTQDIILEINSNDSDEVQELSDEEIVFTPVEVVQKSPSVKTNADSSRAKRKKMDLLLMSSDDEDTDDYTHLMGDFTDDVHP
ncbi:proline-, glutamic acid- and leucine-rich protein 1-like [Phlebotomus argentipes]|uniref:proline-, glutamic acid- and leucine-rich protein 1-like n=1 Tax=Phlebotomus argentipes TaxID=94469 RepID=UPI002892EFF2|nr:proline-, glutamic acid- and leucine-rich protein 1-like [Phlebotomus argentipes]